MINPHNLETLYSYCEHKKRWSDQHAVISLSNKILELSPNNINAQENIAIANSALGNYTYAARDIEQAMFWVPQNACGDTRTRYTSQCSAHQNSVGLILK